ncbi:MAG: UDP-N-acetylglucosamine 1-carboxyvinyltransferase [Candidatus Kerfeldbacteria bacterium]|nr:UDP-N-acetylglucosamine 1-carboxyvinyltransferase [Candidatus Kerfeldbacteria bacterium]
MDKFIIQGGYRLHGNIAVRGAKNHALKVFAASVLTDQPMTVDNVPEIEDIFRLAEILTDIGATIRHPRHGHYTISTAGIHTTHLPKNLVPRLRAAIVLTGPLLARFHSVVFPHPGGCAIGRRPIDIFIAGFKTMGARFQERNGVYRFQAPHGLHGGRFVFPKVSVTATETLMQAAVLADGTTELVNVAREPEILVLANYLNSQGAQIHGAGTSELTITGVAALRAGQCTIMPDRIETVSFIVLALASNSRLTIIDCDPTTIEVPLQLLRASGAKFTVHKNSLTVHPWKKLKPMVVATEEYPGFPTDGQSPLTVLLTQIPGSNEVVETIYGDRLFYTDMLNRMGAHIVMHTPQHVIIHGGTALRGKQVESPDLRAGIAMVIAACIAQGKSEIGNVYQIDRGYEAIDRRLRSIGVHIRRVSN